MEPAPPLTAESTKPLPTSSLGARMLNVFVTPGDVFDEIKFGRGSVTNWLVPVLLSCLVGMISVWVIFSQENILHQLQEQRERAMAKQFAHLPKAEREKALQTVESFSSPMMMRLFGSIGVAFSTFLWLFFLALVVWGSGRLVFKARFTYAQTLEMVGLAGLILVLGGIVGTLLIVGLGTMTATPGAALLIRHYEPANKLHQVAASCNVVTLWYLAVLSVGLGRLSGVSAWKSFAWLFGLWALLRAAMILSGLGSQGM